ncbi:MAG: cell division protein ZapB [Desulfobacterales bacterium]|nr:cell division protein ZapB [Desulfobacterales bacterium]
MFIAHDLPELIENLLFIEKSCQAVLGGSMEEESFPEQFKKLEDKVQQLVQTCRDLQQAKSGLEAKIYELEGTLKTKLAAEQHYAEEKSMIGSKINNLLSRLDQVLGPK